MVNKRMDNQLDYELIDRLNADNKAERLAAAFEAGEQIRSRNMYGEQTDEVNNHIHTSFSFSPYSPSKAAFMARVAGLKAAGSVDHDSIGAAAEMVEACRAFGIGSTTGFELRVNFSGTSFEDRKLNNPDQKNSGYIVVHGVPHNRIHDAAQWLNPINEERNKRNRNEVDRLNKILPTGELDPIDFDRDVYPLSEAEHGGSITERHILFALSNKIIDSFGKGPSSVEFVRRKLGIDLSSQAEAFLNDKFNPHYAYDLLGVLKGNLVSRFFILPNEKECPKASDAVDFANNIGAIPAYSYLGDVAESPTGDKRAEKFEDDFLDELFCVLGDTGFKAITYMPPRNTLEQLLRVQKLCGEHDFMQISGVDINSSRQVFNCPEIMKPEFSHLIDSTWALIAHEHLASADSSLAMFSGGGKFSDLKLEQRIGVYAELGRKMDLENPGRITDIL